MANTSLPIPDPQHQTSFAVTPRHSKDRPHLDLVSKGFDLSALAGTFIAAIQSQIMSTTLGADNQTAAIRAINAFYIGGLVLDLMAAVISFLTARWLQRLSEKEKDLFEDKLRQKVQPGEKSIPSGLSDSKPASVNQERASGQPEEGGATAETVFPLHERIFHAWLSLSLFMPLPLLLIGVVCMIAGIYTYVWTQQPRVVAVVVTLAGGATLPFLAGIFFIGQKEARREAIISRLATMQGDW